MSRLSTYTQKFRSRSTRVDKPVGEIRATRNMMKYGFACGKLSVRTSAALDRNAIERLIDAADLRERIRLLSDTPYWTYLQDATTLGEVEHGLDGAVEASLRLLGHAGLDHLFERFFRCRCDYENIKVIVKSRHLRRSPNEYLRVGGMYPPITLLEHPDTLEPGMSALFEDLSPDELAHAQYPLTSDVDDWIDRVYFGDKLEIAERTRVGFLVSFVRLEIDMANAKITLRCLRAGFASTVLKTKLIEGGTIAPAIFISKYVTARKAKEVEIKGGGERVDASLLLAESLNQLTPFKAIPPGAMDDPKTMDVALRIMQEKMHSKGARMPAGPEPIVAYVARIEAETALLRILLVGTENGVDPEQLRQYLIMVRS